MRLGYNVLIWSWEEYSTVCQQFPWVLQLCFAIIYMQNDTSPSTILHDVTLDDAYMLNNVDQMLCRAEVQGMFEWMCLVSNEGHFPNVSSVSARMPTLVTTRIALIDCEINCLNTVRHNYIYIYIYREREREIIHITKTHKTYIYIYIHTHVYIIHIYIYMYTYLYRHYNIM